MMTEQLAVKIRQTQAALRQRGDDYLLAEELAHLDVLVRLVTEFAEFVGARDPELVDEARVIYECESIFSGVDSFSAASNSCRSIGAGLAGKLVDIPASRKALQQNFLLLFGHFERETEFRNQCRILLELFRLELLFAGLTYY